MASEGIQIQSGFVLQQFKPLDGRSAAASRAVRNAIEQKYDRMVVVLDGAVDRGTICTLKPVGPGYTLTTWGADNAHWAEEAPDDELPVEPGTGPFFAIPWADACDAVRGLNGQPPLPEGEWIKITDRPHYQEQTYGVDVNEKVFHGDIILFVLDPAAPDFVGRRARLFDDKEGDATVETETVHYRLLTDELLRIVDERGNDVRGGQAISMFPFQLDAVRGNVVEEGAVLAFVEPFGAGINVATPTQLKSFAGTIFNNHLQPGARVWLGSLVGYSAAYQTDLSGNVFATGSDTRGVVRNHSADPADLAITTCTFRAASFWSNGTGVPVLLTGCRFEAYFELPPLPWFAAEPSGGLAATGRELTPTASTFELRFALDTFANQNQATLDLTYLAWVGNLICLDPNAPAGAPIMIDGITGLDLVRPVRLTTPPAAGNGFESITFLHNEYLRCLLAADIELQGEYLEAVTVGRVIPPGGDNGDAERARIITYERYRPYESGELPGGGHVIVHNGAPLPQQPNLVLVGDVQATDDPATQSTILTFQGEQGVPGAGYQTTSGSANILAAGERVFVCDTPAHRLAYTLGARVRASAATDPAAYFQEGIVTGAVVVGDVLTLTVNVEFVSMASVTGQPFAVWNLNVAGEPPLYRPGQVDYVAGKATLRLETGSAFFVDLSSPALGGATTITLDYTGVRAGLSVRIRVKQRPTAPFRQLAYTPGKFATAFGAVNGAVPLQQTANSVDKMTGAFDNDGPGDGLGGIAGPMVLVFVPAISLIA